VVGSEAAEVEDSTEAASTAVVVFMAQVEASTVVVAFIAAAFAAGQEQALTEWVFARTGGSVRRGA
jgi:hypothetical protein